MNATSKSLKCWVDSRQSVLNRFLLLTMNELRFFNEDYESFLQFLTMSPKLTSELTVSNFLVNSQGN